MTLKKSIGFWKILCAVLLRCKVSRGTCAARKQRQRRCTGQRGYSLSQKRISPLEPQEKDFVLSDCSLKNCTRCAIRCLLDDVSKRFDFLLSSLSLCLRFVSLTQSPSTMDLCKFASACRGDFAALAAIYALSVVGDYTEPAIRFESGSG